VFTSFLLAVLFLKHFPNINIGIPIDLI